MDACSEELWRLFVSPCKCVGEEAEWPEAAAVREAE